MTTPQDPNQSPFTPAVHKDRPLASESLGGLDENSRQGLRGKLIESILQIVVQALTGGFIPGIPAFTQIADWAIDLVTSIPVIGPILQWLADIFGIDLGDVGDPGVDPPSLWGGVTDLFIKPLNAFAELIGGLIPSSLISILDPTKILNLPNLFTNVFNGFTGIFNSIFGGGASTATTLEDAIAEAATAVNLTISPNNPAVVDLSGRVAVLENQAGGNTFFDGWDRTAVGVDWSLLQGGVAFKTDSIGNGYIQGNTTTTGDLRYDAEQFLTAQHYAQMRICEVESGSVALAIMADSTPTHFAAVRIEDPAFTSANNFISIVSGVGPDQSDLTMRDEFNIGRTWKVGDVIGIGYDPSTETYIAYLNDAPMCLWTDTGAAVVPITGRHVHVLTNVNGGFSGNRGAGVDNVLGYDWT